MSEFYTGKSVIKDAATGEIKAYELSKDSYEYLEYEAKRAIGLEKRVEELEEHTKTLESDLNKEVQHNNYLHKKNRRYKQALEYAQSELEYAHVTGNMDLRGELIKNSLKAIDKALEQENEQ